MITVGNKSRDVVFSKSLQSTPELELRLQAFVFAVKYVACNDNRVHLLPNRQIDNVQKRLQRCITQTLSPIGFDCRESLERAVDMQIGTMDETKGTQDDPLRR